MCVCVLYVAMNIDIRQNSFPLPLYPKWNSHTPSNQTWLSGKPQKLNGGFNGKIIELNGGFQQAM